MEQRNKCADLSITKQRLYYSNVINAAANKQKALFRVVDQVLDRKANRVLPSHTDPSVLANEFNKYYIEKIDKLRESIPKTSANKTSEMPKFEGIKLEVFAPTTIEEVKEIVKEFGVKT